jgi:phosphatidylglycerophosphate synthase
MDLSRPQLVILADAPDALVELFGISLLERLLRIAQRLGFREAVIDSKTPAEITAHLSERSWASAEVLLNIRSRTGPVLLHNTVTGNKRTLLVSAGFYYDARLLQTLARQDTTTILIDSAPPPESIPLSRPLGTEFSGAALIGVGPIPSDAGVEPAKRCDAASEPTYVTALRRAVRPVFFPAPPPDLMPLAEKYVRDIAQNGVLDFPGFLDSPIEDWIVARLCRTSIRPNQITFVTMLIGLAVTACFATGRLWWGVILAYFVEVLDGVDGKLARTKVETTAAGEWEHETDYVIELSWWAALAFHFYTAGLSSAFWLLGLYVGADLLDRLAKRAAKKKVGRNLDDVSNFDRFVRCIGARRNINVWILIAALALADAMNGFVLICWWMAATAVAHLLRAVQICQMTNDEFRITKQ